MMVNGQIYLKHLAVCEQHKVFKIFWPFFKILHEDLTLMQMSSSELMFSLTEDVDVFQITSSKNRKSFYNI